MNEATTGKNGPQGIGAAGRRAHSAALWARLRALARSIRQGYLQIFGIPDYERYVAHRTARHPGEPLLSRQKFSAQAIDRKYRGNGPRCC